TPRFDDFVKPIVMRPSSSSSFFTLRSAGPPGELGAFAGLAAGAAEVREEPPMEEKFHLPDTSSNKFTSGFSIATPVRCSEREKIRGLISTPTFNDLAVRKGEELNFGSSAMERFPAVSEPLSSERLRLPTSTLRPSAVVSFSSIVGRKE